MSKKSLFVWFCLLTLYIPLQIALNPGLFLGGQAFKFDLASLRLFIIILFLGWLALRGPKIIKERTEGKFLSLQAVCFFLFLLLASLSLLRAENAWWGLRKIIFFASVFPLYFLVLDLLDSSSKFKKVFLTLIYGANLLVLIGLVQFLSQFIFSLEHIYDFWALHILPVFSGFNLGGVILAYPSWLVNINGRTIMRAFSLFSDSHIFSFYLGLILPLLIVLALIDSKKKYFLLPAFCFLFSGLLFSFARGAYLAVIAAFLVLAYLIWRYLRTKKIPLILCLSLLVFIIPKTPIAERFYSSFDLEEESNLGRLEMWQKSGFVGLTYAWQGVGLGNYPLYLETDLGYRSPVTAHNLFLDIFSETGIFGLMAWLGLIIGSLWRLFQGLKRRTREEKLMRIGLISSLTYFMVHSFFETAIYHPSVFALLMIILGMSTIITKKEPFPNF